MGVSVDYEVADDIGICRERVEASLEWERYAWEINK